MRRLLSLTAVLAVLTGLALLPFLPTVAADDPPAATGSIKGQVVFQGTVPERVKLDVNKDQQACLAKGAILSDEWVVNPKNKGVKWAVVWLAADNNLKAPAKKMPVNPALAKPKSATVEMDQPCCAYEPHVLAMREDQTLIFKNSSGIAHNTNFNGCGVSGNPILNPGADQKVTDTKYTWTAMNVGCNIHGWMKAYVRVFDHPYFAVTDENGNFEIKDVPPGEYFLITWHEATGYKDSKVMMEGGKNVVRAGTPIKIEAGKATEAEPVKLVEPKK